MFGIWCFLLCSGCLGFVCSVLFNGSGVCSGCFGFCSITWFWQTIPKRPPNVNTEWTAVWGDLRRNRVSFLHGECRRSGHDMFCRSPRGIDTIGPPWAGCIANDIARYHAVRAALAAVVAFSLCVLAAAALREKVATQPLPFRAGDRLPGVSARRPGGCTALRRCDLLLDMLPSCRGEQCTAGCCGGSHIAYCTILRSTSRVLLVGGRSVLRRSSCLKLSFFCFIVGAVSRKWDKFCASGDRLSLSSPNL